MKWTPNVGDRVRVLKDVGDAPDDDRPGGVYARAGEQLVVRGVKLNDTPRRKYPIAISHENVTDSVFCVALDEIEQDMPMNRDCGENTPCDLSGIRCQYPKCAYGKSGDAPGDDSPGAEAEMNPTEVFVILHPYSGALLDAYDDHNDAIVRADHLRQAYYGPYRVVRYILAESVEAKVAAAVAAEQEAWRDWLDNNTMHYIVDHDSPTDAVNVPVLASVSKRIWYHATDDVDTYPFGQLVEDEISRTKGAADGQ